MNSLEIKELCKSYSTFKLDNISLNLPCGCVMGLVGENGAGKSTTIKLILDLIKKDSGTVSVLGKESDKLSTADWEKIGVVLDDVGISECLTANEVNNIMKNMYSKWDSNAYFSYLNRLSVPKDKKFKDLSRGMKMKLGIAVAFSHDASILIFDEATASLDPVVRDDVIDMLFEFTRDENHSVLISSHIVSDLEKICDYIAFMHQGRLVLCEEKDRIYENYGIIRCSREQSNDIDESAIIGKRTTPYGEELLVNKKLIPQGLSVGKVDIEQLFIFMAKENVK